MANGGKVETVRDFIFLGSKITADSDCSHKIKRCLLPGRKGMTNINRVLKSRDITLPSKVCNNESAGFSSSHVWMWELDHKEGWLLKNWFFLITVLEKTLGSPLDCKVIKPKGNQSWIFRTEAEALIHWLPDEKSQLIGKDPDAGKDWGQEEKGMTEDEMIGWHHLLSGHDFEQTLGDSEGLRKLVCCSPWGRNELGYNLSTEQPTVTSDYKAYENRWKCLHRQDSRT